ncbi:AfsR/SARP family transcriptional regulator [Streptomyces fumanus]|uniref:SARP family transcriptional regulator n=1 Tax=Streptomyces fumanus TaxID=67302 RepID=A0A919AJL5_9ACTN|nr:AfsR/SARP family transcriptional regulator [Streptomyces fumanus]GHF10600.1 SARP family transcriptional regulator [Streptomyces fumanus]
MQIRILGPLEISTAEKEKPVASRRAGMVLALLALSPGRVIPFEQLVDELWADSSMANARNALHAHIVRIRRAMSSTSPGGGKKLCTTRNGYVLDVPPDAVDAVRFTSLADAGRERSADDPVAACRLLVEALSLWRGPALMEARDGVRCRISAADLEERRLTVYEDLTELRLAAGLGRVAIPELRQLAESHMERERLTELFMLALYREGRQSEALAAFQAARRRLADGLGVEPGRSMRKLHQAILQQAEVLGEPRGVTRADAYS